MTTSSNRRASLRRYPALAFLVAAGVLALLLPSSLRVPLSGPPSVAELAPVPAKSDSSAAGDMSELGQAGSGGLGSGGAASGLGRGSSTTQPPDAGLPSQRRPSGKRCVGSPPRQTENPLSPPCVAHFDGDNGGATSRGVTRSDVTVVVWAGTSTSTIPAGFHDWTEVVSDTDSVLDQVGKAFTQYFNNRYQTYGRRVRVLGYFSPSGETPAGYRAAVVEADRREAFAFVPVRGASVMAPDAASRKIVTVTYNAFDRSTYQQGAPFIQSFNPDLDDQAAMVATYACSKLAGRPARWAPDQTMRSRTRTFGIASQDFVEEPDFNVLRSLVESELSKRCGIKIEARAIASGDGSNRAASYPPGIAALRSAGVTTVLMVASGGVSGNFSQHAGGQGYLPEWFVAGGGSGDNGADRNTSGQLHNQTAWAGAFGITFDYRRDAVDAQPWHEAFREACPDCPENRHSDAPRLFDQLALLFRGVQAAGPKLTPESMDRGMHAIPPKRSVSPYAPAAYFAPGNYSFVKDAAEIAWDGAGRAPSDNRPGCYRMVGGGSRSRAGEWTGDDSAFFSPSDPCQGVAQRGPGS